MSATITLTPTCVAPFLVGAFQPIQVQDDSIETVISRTWMINGELQSNTQATFFVQLPEGNHTIELSITYQDGGEFSPILESSTIIDVPVYRTSPVYLEAVPSLDEVDGKSFTTVKALEVAIGPTLLCIVGKTSDSNTFDTIYCAHLDQWDYYIFHTPIERAPVFMDLMEGANIVAPRLHAMGSSFGLRNNEIWAVDGISAQLYRLRSETNDSPIEIVTFTPLGITTRRFVAWAAMSTGQIVVVSWEPGMPYHLHVIDPETGDLIQTIETTLEGEEIISCEAGTTNFYMPIGCTAITGNPHTEIYQISMADGTHSVFLSDLNNPDVIQSIGTQGDSVVPEGFSDLIIWLYNPEQTTEFTLSGDTCFARFHFAEGGNPDSLTYTQLYDADLRHPSRAYYLGGRASWAQVIFAIFRTKPFRAISDGNLGYPSFAQLNQPTTPLANLLFEIFLPQILG